MGTSAAKALVAAAAVDGGSGSQAQDAQPKILNAEQQNRTDRQTEPGQGGHHHPKPMSGRP